MTDEDAGVRFGAVKARIADAAEAAGRKAGDVTLIAVSKTHGPNRVATLIAAGQRVFGENRVQEAQAKWPALKAEHSDLELHLIGPLQTNKARDAVALFDVIQSLDREKLARAVADAAQGEGRCPRLLVQVNTGAEPQKSGCDTGEAETFVARCRGEFDLPVEGLMCLPPFDEDPAPHFARLAELGARCGLPVLSMGMSADFETAIAHGATHVRVGTALFGARPGPHPIRAS